MTGPATHPQFHGDGGTLFGIHLKNLLLTIVTLGIYSFWARADVRQYLYAQTSVGHDRFAYHGNGGELFKGWIRAVGLLLLVFLVAGIISWVAGEIAGAIAGYGTAALFIFPLAMIGSRRYRLSRTSWRGIRFSFRGDYAEFMKVYVPGILLTLVTLGLYYPFFHANVRRYVVDATRFGSGQFTFTGEGGDLFGRHLALYLLLPLTLGFYWYWHVAFRHRYYWEHTGFGTARFTSTMRGGDLLVFSLVNTFLTMITLGIAYPWVQARTMVFQCERLGIAGMEAFDAAQQDAQAAGVTGEGLSDMMDVELAGADFFGL